MKRAAGRSPGLPPARCRACRLEEEAAQVGYPVGTGARDPRITAEVRAEDTEVVLQESDFQRRERTRRHPRGVGEHVRAELQDVGIERDRLARDKFSARLGDEL